ncbi:uncharacterized protein LOC8054517 [Sorghum bicolor]|uniref:uncharacterized protein LOC8054517 n=1 Tax=Sorghum bicolor TaxID=4558 RepID=UPI000B426D03|nr:uncharacterized protein LOC8054517 [Sorghum bicolor]|eukprot:XP_021308079.1 uncharacterized protein LOC8054517 [Sorghum bicolor]
MEIETRGKYIPQLPLFNPSSLLFALSISLPTQIGDGGYCDLNALPCWRASAVLAPAFSPSLPPSLLVSLSPEGIAGAAAAAARFPPVSTTPVSARLCPGLPLLFLPLSSSPSLPRASHGRRWRPISLRSAPLHGRWSLFGSAQQIGGQSACLRILLVHVYLVLTYLRFSFQGHRTTKIIKKLEPTCYILAACKRNNDFLVLWIVLEDIDFRQQVWCSQNVIQMSCQHLLQLYIILRPMVHPNMLRTV